ncbi:MAG: choice-of-anchor Q domain-containing protein [Myxococcota bacterium]
MLFWLLTTPALAATLTVTSDADSGAGTLREALASAVDGDDIVFNGVTVVTLSSGLTVAADVLIDGGGVTLESDGGNFSILTVGSDVTFTAQDLTFAGGFRSGTNRGAGLSNDGTTTLIRSVIRDCAAFNAAGFDNRGRLTLLDAAIVGNQTTGNSGAGGTNSATLVAVNTTFANNVATGSGRVGGGLAQFGDTSTSTLSHVTFAHNSATGQGGGFYVSEGTATLRNTLFANNAAPSGPDVWGISTSQGYNLIEQADGLTLEGAIASDQVGVTGSVQDLDESGFPVVPIDRDSSAFEAGSCTDIDGASVSIDGRGLARPQGFTCDIGAYEVMVETIETVTAEPAGDLCREGGQRRDTGFDLNADGTLNEDEIVSTIYVCTETGEVTTLVSVTLVPPGADCGAGGQRIDVGVDDNDDAVLSDDEIDETTFVCTTVETETIEVTTTESTGCSTAPGWAWGLWVAPLAFLRRSRNAVA